MFSSLHQVLFWLGHLINVKRPVGLRLEFWLKCSSICFSIWVPLWCRSCMEQTPPRIPSTSSRSVNYISFLYFLLKILHGHFFNGIARKLCRSLWWNLWLVSMYDYLKLLQRPSAGGRMEYIVKPLRDICWQVFLFFDRTLHFIGRSKGPPVSVQFFCGRKTGWNNRLVPVPPGKSWIHQFIPHKPIWFVLYGLCIASEFDLFDLIDNLAKKATSKSKGTQRCFAILIRIVHQLSALWQKHFVLIGVNNC